MAPQDLPSTYNDQTKSLCILGLGREGLSTYQFLRQLFPARHIYLFDEKPLEALTTWHEIAKKDESVTSFHTTVPQQTLTNPVIFCTPGIPQKNPLFQALTAVSPQWTSNLEVFFENLPPTVVTIGVTGTKGKSTTSGVIFHLLKTAGLPVVLAGNGGTPALAILEEVRTLSTTSPKVYVVLELSSHQLSKISHSPNIAVIQNITPEHLDYYSTFEEYVAAKAQIVRSQKPEDLVIFCADYPEPTNIAITSLGEKLSFSLQTKSGATSVETNNNALSIDGKTLTTLDALPLRGTHNIINIVPGVLIAQKLSIPTETITHALHSFTPLQHRLEPVPSTDGVLYINDSLATTPEATMAALDSVSGKPCILIAGGHDRHLDYYQLAKAILRHKVKALILFPPTGETIIHHIHQLEPTNTTIQSNYFKVTSMWEAVKKATSFAKPGDVVLLSPAAASFGIFKDYQDRGEQFKQAVADLTRSETTQPE